VGMLFNQGHKGGEHVTPPKLALANPVELLAIHPNEPTCDQLGDHPCKIVRVGAKEDE
jgi:hypothetical protein